MSRPKLSLSTEQLTPIPPTLKKDYVHGNSRAGFEETPIVSAATSIKCDYCLQNHLLHDLEMGKFHGDEMHSARNDESNYTRGQGHTSLRRYRRRCTENTGALAVLEALINIQMKIMSV
ncbi:hypothetical protein SCARD494_01799 [Seiridium cardinale]